MNIFTGIGIAAYVYMTFMFARSRTVENTKFHEGGFLGLGYTTNSHRDLTTKDVWIGIVWPLSIIVSLLAAILHLTNDLVHFLSLIIGLRYKETKLYKWIDNL